MVEPQTVERGGRRFVIALAREGSKQDVDFLLDGGPLADDDDLKA